MLTGNVTVAVIDNGGAEDVPFRGEIVTLVGCNAGPVMLAVVVGNGWTGGRPSVAIVVITDPVVTAVLGIVSLCDCVLGTGVMVTVSTCLPAGTCSDPSRTVQLCSFSSRRWLLSGRRKRGNHLQCTVGKTEMSKIYREVSKDHSLILHWIDKMKRELARRCL